MKGYLFYKDPRIIFNYINHMYKIYKVLYSKDYDLKSFEDETEKNKHNLMRT